jgi:hypothetical protein
MARAYCKRGYVLSRALAEFIDSNKWNQQWGPCSVAKLDVYICKKRWTLPSLIGAAKVNGIKDKHLGKIGNV